MEELYLNGVDFAQEYLKVRDIMQKENIKIYADDSLEQVEGILEWEGLEHCCVLNESGNFLGLLDLNSIKILKKLMATKKLCARDITHDATHFLFGFQNAGEGISVVLNDFYRTCPVFENSRLVGILSIDGHLSLKGEV